MTEPWNLTEAQRRQFREAHAEAKRKQMTETGFGGWPLDRLTAQRDHLQSVLLVSAGQSDRPQIREEYDAVCAEIAKRSGEGPPMTETTAGTCGHEFSLSGVGYQCQRPPHPVDDGNNIPAAPCRHAAAIDAGLAEGTEEHEGQGDADLITWGEDETGEGQDWDLAWGDVSGFTTQSHGAYREKP